MSLEDVKRSENFCPRCNELSKSVENLDGIRVCVNDECIVKTFRLPSASSFVSSKVLYPYPDCPECGDSCVITEFGTVHCDNTSCVVDKIDMDTYIKVKG